MIALPEYLLRAESVIRDAQNWTPIFSATYQTATLVATQPNVVRLK